MNRIDIQPDRTQAVSTSQPSNEKPFPHLALLLPAAVPVIIREFLLAGGDRGQRLEVYSKSSGMMVVVTAAAIALVIEAFVLPGVIRRLWSNPGNEP